MGITLTDFYKILKEFVRYYPDGICVSPQTFRAFQKGMALELSTSNLGALPTEKDSPFFYSKAWANKFYSPNALTFKFPVVGTLVLSTDVTDTTKRNQKHCETIELMVLDVLSENCGTPKAQGCESRSINEIFADTKTTLSQAIWFLSGVVLATVNGGATPKIYHVQALGEQKMAGEISSFEIKKRVGWDILAANQTLQFLKVEKPAQAIFGTSVVLKVCFLECQDEPIDFSLLQNTAILSFESGCQNCN